MGEGYPNQNSIACTCYAAGGIPLSFTQEDFLVFNLVTCTRITNLPLISPSDSIKVFFFFFFFFFFFDITSRWLIDHMFCHVTN